jgi:hypothetical protein
MFPSMATGRMAMSRLLGIFSWIVFAGFVVSAGFAVRAESVPPGEQSSSPDRVPSGAAAGQPAEPEIRPAASPAQLASGFLSTICQEIRSAAAAHNLPANFLIRLIWQESGFDPDAVSRAGAQGIAQFMPATAQWRGLINPFDAHMSIRESARWLGELRGQFGNLGLAAAAYNAGPKRVKEWLDGSRGLPSETRAYVHVVTERAAEEWARPGVRDDKINFLFAPPDCRFEDIASRVVLTRIARAPRQQNANMSLGGRPAIKNLAWSLQLIGDKSEETAMKEYGRLQQKFPGILGAKMPIVIKKQLGGRGAAVWYQVRIAERSRDAANVICSKLRVAGGECLVLSTISTLHDGPERDPAGRVAP